MTPLLVMLPSFAFVLGAAVMGIVGIPIARRRAYNDGLEDARVLVGPALLREGDLPVQLGTLPEHQRRLRPPMQYVEILDSTALAVEQNPLGAEPAFGQVRVGVTGRAVPAIAVGNAAPTMEKEEAPSQAGAAAGSSCPLVWWFAWPALVLLLFATHPRYLRQWWDWDTPAGRRLDRLCVRLGRRERRYFAQHRHARNASDEHAERCFRVLFERTQELPVVEVEPERELIGAVT